MLAAQQAEQRAREEAENALELKHRFLNNISHEMRTPLNSIVGFSEVIANLSQELTDEEKKDLSQRIRENADMLTSIVDNMIMLSTYENKTELPKNDVISPNHLAREIISSHSELKRKRVKMSFNTDLDDNFTMRNNRESIGCVLTHLIENALKFTQKGWVYVNCSKTALGFVRFSVADTGPGITAERQEKLFELFQETGQEVKTTGMGLSICRSISRLLGGNIWFDKAYVGGSRFVFEIPVD